MKYNERGLFEPLNKNDLKVLEDNYSPYDEPLPMFEDEYDRQVLDSDGDSIE